ncbi:MAG: MOSC domain-containing protein [Paracoccaceae bacterium]
MPSLVPTEITGTITWLGLVPHRNEPVLEGVALKRLELGFEGIPGSIHGGLTRASCSRVVSQHPKGTEIRNARQVSIVSAEEVALIAAELGLETIDPAHLGASIVVSGIADFSHVPPSSRLQAANGTTLVVDMENRPCQYPAMAIEKAEPGHGKGFKPAAKGLRGIMGWVERPGVLEIGDTLVLHVPDQPVWNP